ncbi:hypothetical protein FRB97_000611 [Tulasnella sp. 331]|nr:hypothetical protein FRB97_000611 [Tulasnella sp. 331]
MWKISVLAVAASLLSASVDALGTSCTAPLTPSAAAGGPSWMQTITRRGSSAYNTNPGAATYKPFRNVMSYGAKGDGVTDDTAAINAAISDQNRCGLGCASSTLAPAIIYFPQGNYLVSSAIIPFYLTQLVGDATNPPTITASSTFSGYVIDADPYIPNGYGAQYWVNQNNFFKSLRHFKIDLTKTPATSGVSAIHWQVAQATTLVDIVVNMSTDPSTTQVGLFMENGSGGFMSDLVFNGGKYGINVGTSESSKVRNLTVNNAQTGVYANWAWGWTYQGVNFNNCGIGFDINEGGINAAHQTVGSEVIVDGNIVNTPIFIQTTNSYNGTFAGSILLDNIKFTGVTTGVKDSSGATKLAGGTTTIRQWAQGNTYSGVNAVPTYQQALVTSAPTKPAALINSANGNIYSRGRTDYPQYAASQFASVKAAGAVGDGVTDDTAAIQAFINANWGCKVLFFDAGTYYVTSTVTLPTGSIMVGEVWTTIIGGGANFANQASPLPVFKVGNAGEKGATEISDIVFSARSGSAGAIVVEWNTADTAGKQATAAAWDIHVRLGGFTGSGMQVSNCAKLTGHAVAPCTAAFIGLHITASATAYLEGTWIDVYTGRGIVTESQQGPVWLIGTASEHADIVQYNFANAQNVYAGFIQTETAYYQPSPAAPSPFAISTTYNDPTLTNGAMGWALAIGGDSNSIFIYGAGHYNFFNNYDSTCQPLNNCQVSMVKVASTTQNIYIYGLSTVGSTYMLNVDATTVIKASDNANGFADTFTLWKSANTGGAPNSSSSIATSATSTSGTTSTKTTTSTSATASSTSGMQYVGCYTDQGSPRTLSSYSTTSASMTNALCLSTCTGMGYTYAGTEYADECYCGNSLSGGTLDSVDTDCNAACAGDSTKICGGSYRLSVYTAGGTTVSTTATTTKSSATSTSTGGAYQGCYSDSATVRTLSGYSTTSAVMTNALCESTCLAQGYTYAGTEYGDECYCGNSLSSGTLDPTDADCNATCAGGGTAKCGATYKLSVYKTS